MRLPRAADGPLLADVLARAGAVLEETSPPALALSIFDDEPRRSSLVALVRRLSHVGLLAPRGVSPPDLAAAARHVGFADDHVLFPSVTVARELSALAGEPVTTHVFRCRRARSEGGFRPWIEAFVVDGAPDAFDRWLDEGVASHVGLDVEHHDSSRVRDILESGGFAPPSFMRDGPVRNPMESHSMLYLEGRARDGEPLRLELEIA